MNRMNIEGVKEGYVRLSSPNGIVDTRNGDVFAEVIVKEKSAKFFKEVGDKVKLSADGTITEGNTAQ